MADLNMLVGLSTGLRWLLKRSLRRRFGFSYVLFVTTFALNNINKVLEFQLK